MDMERPIQVADFFHPLRARLGGLPVNETLYQGTPEWMRPALVKWVSEFFQSDSMLARNVTFALRLSMGNTSLYASRIALLSGEDLLEAVDACLALHSSGERLDRYIRESPSYSIPPDAKLLRSKMVSLEEILSRCGSYLRVDGLARRLVRRVDATAQASFDEVRIEAPEDAARLLESAWIHAYGLDPDPDKSYSESVKAVEAVLNPLVSPNDSVPTLGKTLSALRQQAKSGKWEINVGDAQNQGQNIERFTGMVDLLWKNQLSRHAGGANARSQDQHEAEAVLHLAVLIVQWVNTNVIKKV
ncbi:hypothetical protein ACFVWN_01230 [Nocardiopsis flavescens]|uniref:hypothetical protein n=1 Tax=Nocardiopsis flavescens TaxID=758803 RepID=UPI0036499653